MLFSKNSPIQGMILGKIGPSMSVFATNGPTKGNFSGYNLSMRASSAVPWGGGTSHLGAGYFVYVTVPWHASPHKFSNGTTLLA